MSAELSQQLDWRPRRLNPALTYLVKHRHTRASTEKAYPFAYFSIVETSETRRFVWSRKGTPAL